jgi:hypothetical protein
LVARLPRTFSAVLTAVTLPIKPSIYALTVAGSFFFRKSMTILTIVCAVAAGIPVFYQRDLQVHSYFSPRRKKHELNSPINCSTNSLALFSIYALNKNQQRKRSASNITFAPDKFLIDGLFYFFLYLHQHATNPPGKFNT